MREGATFNWTSKQETILRTMWADGKSMAAIGLVMGLTRNQIAGRISRLGIKRGTGRPSVKSWLPYEDEALIEAAKDRLNWSQIAVRVGRSSKGCVKRAAKLGLTKGFRALPKRRLIPSGAGIPRKPIRQPATILKAPANKPVSILQVGEFNCRAIVGGVAEKTMYCGAKVPENSDGSPRWHRFCPYHASIYMTPYKRKRDGISRPFILRNITVQR